ncbi:MAG: Gfo/Idh/MocA family oxidoreductase [Acidobacteria bacterium]|nr:Gfo/Idh/MocA family oxidoreductase [Acidobacteriota bacterium]MBI3657652.1 Gfo/Idh/MocA family oxidoreductase [Acidobacteriota bacterium]
MKITKTKSSQAASLLCAGIAGAGLMGQWHAHALRRAGGRVIAFADVDTSSANSLAQAHAALAFSSLDDLLTRAPIDVLHICTPPATHEEMASQALDAGVHVLAEKPLTPDAVSTARLLEKAHARGRLLLPVHQMVFQRGMRQVKTHLSRLAPLLHLEVIATTAGGEKTGAEGLDPLVADILPHPLSIFQHFLPEGLDGSEWSVLHPSPGELRAQGQAQRISLAINLSARGRPTRNVFNIIGARGSAHVDLYHGFAVFEGGQTSRTQKIMRPFGLALRTLTAATLNLATRTWQNEPAYPGLLELIRADYDAIRKGEPAPLSPLDILAVARARDRLISAW